MQHRIATPVIGNERDGYDATLYEPDGALMSEAETVLLPGLRLRWGASEQSPGDGAPSRHRAYHVTYTRDRTNGRIRWLLVAPHAS